MKRFLLLISPFLALFSAQIVWAQVENVCDPNADWKNHGAYVSCVAKQKPGGQVVSDAAKSDIGKKNNQGPTITTTPTPSIEPTGTTTPTPTPTEELTPTPTVEATPTPTGETTPTPTPEVIETGSQTENNALIRDLIQTLKELIKSIKDLL